MYLPIGTILPYSGTIDAITRSKLANDGFLPCDGSNYSCAIYKDLYSVIKNTYGGNSTAFLVPDYRGLFLRGCDAGRGEDPGVSGRSGGTGSDRIGSRQDDAFRSHSHFVGYKHHRSFCGANDSDHPIKNCNGSNYSTGESGGNETRPKNIYVNYIIYAGIFN